MTEKTKGSNPESKPIKAKEKTSNEQLQKKSSKLKGSSNVNRKVQGKNKGGKTPITYSRFIRYNPKLGVYELVELALTPQGKFEKVYDIIDSSGLDGKIANLVASVFVLSNKWINDKGFTMDRQVTNKSGSSETVLGTMKKFQSLLSTFDRQIEDNENKESVKTNLKPK